MNSWFSRRVVSDTSARRRQRTAGFNNRAGNRYWWFREPETTFDPPLFSFLTEEEWSVLDNWYAETDRLRSAGEANIPAMSMLQAIIMGNKISNMVQLGHYQGFSSLLLGFMFRRMGFQRALFSIDIDEGVSKFTSDWITKAGLNDYVQITVGSSSDPRFPDEARSFFQGDIQIVFVDSSHAYDHTLEELDLWYKNLVPNGFMLLHDASRFASQYDPSGKGGVKKALDMWAATNSVQIFSLNADIEPNVCGSDLVYKDACGFGIIQRPPVGRPDGG